MSKSTAETVRWAAAAFFVLLGMVAGASSYSVMAKARGIRKPLLAQTVVEAYRPDRSWKRVQTVTEAVRGDGSIALETVRVERGESTVSRELWLTPTRTVWTYAPNSDETAPEPIDSLEYAKLTLPVTRDGLVTRGLGSVVSFAPADSPTLGYQVWRLVREREAADGATVRTEELVAPKLDWKALQSANYLNGRPVERRSVEQLVEGEVASGLFDPHSRASVLRLADYLDLTVRPRDYTAGPNLLRGLQSGEPRIEDSSARVAMERSFGRR